MNILMATNTFTPHVGGVARSTEAFTAEYRRRGHRVLVVAPGFDGQPADEVDVVRIPAIQNFNGSDFSVALPVPRFLTAKIEAFDPDVVHAHHPFLLGATAARVAHFYDRPLVFTHHTMYEQYTHYVPGDSPGMKRFVVDLATHYANLCDCVIAPSETIADVLRRRGVHVPVEVIPTGVRPERFASGDRARFRRRHGIPANAFVIGHVGRLAPEKNLGFLADAVAHFLRDCPEASCLIVGSGPVQPVLRERLAAQGLADRLHLAGTLDGERLVDAYHAMDAFVFASKSETQGMVLVEAMAAGVPVIALDAPGVREVVRDGDNGRLLPGAASARAFAAAIDWLRSRTAGERARLADGARGTANELSLSRTADRSLALYARLTRDGRHNGREAYALWSATRRLIETEWGLLKGLSEATGAALQSDRPIPDIDT
jgi:glycosyltransferase involved in cell wall biosynthesis